ncbi:MAG: GSU2204 family CXXCH-containing (seleno)protein [Candidatus Zixiibacteriota bacterium]
MKQQIWFMLGLALLLSIPVNAQETQTIDRYSIWLGGRYTDFSDYPKKVGEYRLPGDSARPELGLAYESFSPNSILTFDGRFFDEENIAGKLTTTVGDRFRARFGYRSLSRQTGLDSLTEVEAREWLSTAPGGKILTHELTDLDADYSYHRREILSRLSVKLAEKHNMKLMAAHRTVLKDGSKQSITTSHCFSCHLTSQEAPIKEKTHAIEMGVQGEVNRFNLGYLFGYRKFESEAMPPQVLFDEAKHPVNGSSGPEFSSRLNYDDTSLAANVKPRTQKVTHKLRVKREIGKGQFAGNLAYSQVENTLTELRSKAVSGAANYAVVLGPRTHLTVKASVANVSADDPYIDMPLYRDGRPGPTTNFDYTRYSTLDRATIKASAELQRRLSPRLTLALLGGWDRIDRKDYFDIGDNLVSSTIYGQLKLNYARGLKYSAGFRYRMEKTSDPFVSGRGVFEARGREILQRTLPGFAFRFYFEREQLRYQAITTEPTDSHEGQLTAAYRPSGKTSLNFVLKGVYDKNGDLDSLDVRRQSLSGNVALSYLPETRWSFTGGLSYSLDNSRGPVAVALFDG